MKFLLVLLFALCLCLAMQSVGISGRLSCGCIPAAGVKVELWDGDEGIDPDDLLDEGYTHANGRFNLMGSTKKLTNIDPVFKLYHNCDKPGKREIKFRIPDSYISSGGSGQIFYFGEVNLKTISARKEISSCKYAQLE